MKNTHLLSLKNISFAIQSTILDNVCLDVSENEIIMLVGANGSGKSSLLKMINGMYLPCQGELFFQGQPLTKVPLRCRTKDIASMNQDPDLSTFSELSVYENYLLAKRAAATKEEAIAYLQPFNTTLATRLTMSCKKLSGGERQALGLALCLMHKPKLILLDEHTSALDPASAKKLMHITLHTILKMQASAIICTHSLTDALEFGTRLVAMKKGQIALDVKDATKQKLKKEDLFNLY